jgi:hypothetical protein
MRRSLLLLAVLVLAPVPSYAEDAPKAALVQGAIDRGAAWLRERFKDGFAGETWHEPTELVVLTLAHAGANLLDPVFAKGLAVLEKTEPRFTYRTSLLAMALSEVNPRRYQWKIAHCAQWIVDTQLPGGEWGYPGGVEGSMRRPQGATVAPPPPPEGTKPGEAPPPQAKIVVTKRSSTTADRVLKGDFSNTQFAILGLRAAREAGVEVPKETWKAAFDYLKKYQRPDGGWGYVMGGVQDEASYASLTCAGACSAAICLHALAAKDVKGDPVVRKAIGWVRANLEIGKNVGIDQSSVTGHPRPWQYYHLYSLERAARVLGLQEFSTTPWYARGAQWLLEHQGPDGSWTDEIGAGAQPAYLQVTDTCFALLFLTRATKPLTGG